MFTEGSYGALPVTARRAKRENGGLGEDPSGSTITYLQAQEHSIYRRPCAWRAPELYHFPTRQKKTYKNGLPDGYMLPSVTYGSFSILPAEGGSTNATKVSCRSGTTHGSAGVLVGYNSRQRPTSGHLFHGFPVGRCHGPVLCASYDDSGVTLLVCPGDWTHNSHTDHLKQTSQDRIARCRTTTLYLRASMPNSFISI
jgi:hypothetical protein